MTETPDEDYVRVLPLGGLHSFGMNCCLVEHNDTMLMFDCGIGFPGDNHPGLDYYLPDWTYALDNVDKLAGIVLTHSHEDHIGGLPFLLAELDVPIYASRYTMALIQHRLRDSGIEFPSEMIMFEPGDILDVGPFELEFLHVNHSVANACSIAIGTSLGHVLFTGDWKLDQTPIGEPVMDLSGFARLGDEGVLAIIGDSTNAEVPGFSTSEREVQAGLRRVVSEAEGRVVIGMFSSNIPRVRGLVEIAQQTGRKIALLGRSLNQNVGFARETGFLKIEGDNPFIGADKIDSYKPHEVLVLATGSQAEPRSSLARMSQGDHHQIAIRPDDTVVLSARIIPGNETGISKMIDGLIRRGATVITPRNAMVHASGHCCRGEMKLLMNLVRPDWVVPVHGEFRMRQAHAELARELHFRSVLIDDGDVLEFRADDASVVDHVKIGRVTVDGKLLGDIEDVQLRDRRKLAETGVIVAFVVLDRATGAITAEPELIQKGFLNNDEEAADMLDEAATYARDAVEELSAAARTDAAEVGEALRTSIRRYFRKSIDRKPVVVPVVHEL